MQRESSELQAKQAEMMVRESWAGYTYRNGKQRLAREHMHGRALLHLHLHASACARPRRQQLALLQAERNSAWAMGGVVESRPRPEPLSQHYYVLVLASVSGSYTCGRYRLAFPLQYCRVHA